MATSTLTLDDASNTVDVRAFGMPSFDEWIIYTLRGDDTVLSGSSNDLIFSGKGNDKVLAGDGNDFVSAGNGNDTVFGERGNDELHGAGGDDYIHAGKGHDTVYGGSGDDTILGIKGHNQLFGQTGNDYISTGDHTSFVDGGADDDFINVRMKKGGDHVLTGGDGADTFEFVYAFNDNKAADCVITDYELGIDSFSVNGTSGQNIMLELIFGVSSHDWDDTDDGVLIDLASGDSILFESVTTADVGAYYFGDIVVG